jgi:hypothetical protein
MSPNNVTKLLRVAIGSEVYSSTIAASHEFFDLTGSFCNWPTERAIERFKRVWE